MDIPKNTTQVGEVHGDYKVFIEDYVISYLKQLCRQEPDRKKRVAFYGIMRTEGKLQYFFLYGGSEVTRHGRTDTYLADQDYEEITWAGAKYFESYVPLGFITIEDELPEGIYLFLSGRETYVKGYHIFYEKNESMLAFMIHRQAAEEEKKSVEPRIREEHKEEPAQEPKQEQEPALARSQLNPVSPGRHPLRERKAAAVREENGNTGEIRIFGIVKSAAAALFIVLCVTAISTMNGLGKIENLQNFFQKAFQTMTEKKLPDREAEKIQASADPIIEEADYSVSEGDNQEDLFGKMQQENAQTAPTDPVQAEPVEAPAAQNKTHTIQRGETLNAISKMYYGDISQVGAICELNGITNSDNIQVGQKIILP